MKNPRIKNPRINITLEPNILNSLSAIASKNHTALASLAREFIMESLKRYEDMALSDIADKCDTGKEKLISHKNAWK